MFRITPFFLIPIALLAQPRDSQTLDAILQEIRQLRQDLSAMTLVAQRVQILLYRTQLQDDIVSKSIDRHQQASMNLEDMERNRAEVAGNIKDQEEKLRSVQDPAERAVLEDSIRNLKRSLEMWSREESRLRSAELDAGNEVRTEQTKLRELQERLSRMERQLEAYSTAPK
jgi:hypothetical protein